MNEFAAYDRLVALRDKAALLARARSEGEPKKDDAVGNLGLSENIKVYPHSRSMGASARAKGEA